MAEADIGLIGLAVMGQNLILNMNDHGFTVAAYNRTTSKVDDFMNGAAKGSHVIGVHSLQELVSTLKSPRKIFLMVRAGSAVDSMIDQLLPLLDKGDIIIDGGNANYTDTQRRYEALSAQGLRFIGTGVSGGEEGARHGPSIMPGGDPSAWPEVKEILQAIAAKTPTGEACCDWVGEGGAGHFVKMVHNGIEYGDMQLISESYDFMQHLLGMSPDAMSEVFSAWNKTTLDSYLIEIAADILKYKDADGAPIIDKILDAAGQKGTGKWTGINALDEGIPLTLITESVFARCLSALKEDRVAAEALYPREFAKLENGKQWIEDLAQALLASKIISYAQGFMLIHAASKKFGWNINLAATAMLWREGCIIRSAFLDKINDAFKKNPDLAFLGLDDYFRGILQASVPAWRRIVAKAIELGLPMPCTGAGITFLDGYTRGRLPANMIQALRDYFGAHTYERVDKPRGEHFHTNWTGTGGNVASSTYDV